MPQIWKFAAGTAAIALGMAAAPVSASIINNPTIDYAWIRGSQQTVDDFGLPQPITVRLRISGDISTSSTVALAGFNLRAQFPDNWVDTTLDGSGDFFVNIDAVSPDDSNAGYGAGNTANAAELVSSYRALPTAYTSFIGGFSPFDLTGAEQNELNDMTWTDGLTAVFPATPSQPSAGTWTVGLFGVYDPIKTFNPNPANRRVYSKTNLVTEGGNASSPNSQKAAFLDLTFILKAGGLADTQPVSTFFNAFQIIPDGLPTDDFSYQDLDNPSAPPVSAPSPLLAGNVVKASPYLLDAYNLGIPGVSTPTLAFPTTAVSSTSDLAFNVTNSGVAAYNVTSLGFTAPGYSIVSPTPPFSVPVGSPVAVTVRFAPTAAASYPATLSVSTDAESTPTVTLSGTGAFGTPGTSTSSLNFPQTVVTSTSDLNFDVTNTGSVPFTVSALNFVGAGFSIVSPSVPFTVNPGSPTNVVVRFTPTSATAFSSTLTVDTNTPTDPTVSLSGSGDSSVGEWTTITE